MKTARIMAVAVLIVGSGLVAARGAGRSSSGRSSALISMRNDLSVPGREVIQVRVDFPPGLVAPPSTAIRAKSSSI